MHSRLEPVKHAFRYPVYFYSFDLAELPQLGKELGGLFGYNQLRPISLYDRDYLHGAEGSLFERLQYYLRTEGIEDVTRIELVTSARFFNYVFNPVSFFYCYRSDETLRAVAAEVNNTFHETHLYLLHDFKTVSPGRFTAEAITPKSFHVSPFHDMKGDYDFLFSKIDSSVEIRVNILRQGKLTFLSSIKGEAKPLTKANLLKTVIQFPLSATLTMPRILWQAAKLYWAKGLRVYTKPVPQSEMTIRIAGPAFWQRACIPLVRSYLQKFSVGCLTVTFPDGHQEVFGDRDSHFRAAMVIRDYNFFWRSILHGDVGFGEAYTFGEWTSLDLEAVLRLFLANEKQSDDRSVLTTKISRQWHRFIHSFRSNTVRGSRKNISFHYDLSNAFFEKFLDRSMMYSCAVFENPNMTLEEAQAFRLKSIVQKLELRSSDHLLEIGSGWGGMAIAAAKLTGCRVTSVTVSREQLKYAEARVAAEGLQKQIDFQFCDYRQLKGKYDKIVSLEMIEAVGEENLPLFFEKCEALLEPKGALFLQVITLPEERFEKYRYGCDWIQKHIFPGSFIPSLSHLLEAAKHSSSLEAIDVLNIGPHYGPTLREWKRRFEEQKGAIQTLGFDDKFCRAWHYYLSYCEAGFTARAINDLQILFRRPGM